MSPPLSQGCPCGVMAQEHASVCLGPLVKATKVSSDKVRWRKLLIHGLGEKVEWQVLNY